MSREKNEEGKKNKTIVPDESGDCQEPPWWMWLLLRYLLGHILQAHQSNSFPTTVMNYQRKKKEWLEGKKLVIFSHLTLVFALIWGLICYNIAFAVCRFFYFILMDFSQIQKENSNRTPSWSSQCIFVDINSKKNKKKTGKEAQQ